MPDRDRHPAPEPRRLGKGMIIAAWVLLLGLLTVFFDDTLQDLHNPNRRVESVVIAGGERSVQLERNHRGHYLASGRINDRPVTFLIDTGATDVALGEALARQLNLNREGTALSRTANGDVVSWTTHLDRVQLGEILLRDVRAAVLPGMAGDEVLLGMSFLKRLELTQRGETLTLHQLPK